MEPSIEPTRDRAEAPVFLTALAVAWRRPAAWGLYLLALLTLTLPAVLVTESVVTDILGQRYEPGSQMHHFDAPFRVDNASALARLQDVLATLGGPAGLLAFLLGVFAAGGWLGVLLDGPERSSARRFLGGGVRYFWRFARLAVLVLVALAAIHWLLFDWPFRRLVLQDLFGLTRPDLTLFESEATAQRLQWAQAGLHFVLFCLVVTWALYTRTRIALQGGSSVIVAGFATLWLLLRHPLVTLRPIVLLFAVELLLVTAVAGALSRWIDGGLANDPSAWRVLALGVVSFLALVVSAIVFGARYVVALQVARSLVKPLPRPDPWRDRVGPPGGPQYPIGGQDEFSVSV